ncbi:hypothetical protein [Sphingomonas panacis]|uniref:hypothetical protein n=1 Tax=Sphingomonas panacis TaxID=1560345 RepID=UPI000B102217|nr:hypothetical protein [Sphingomonas panacis]
MNDLVRAYGPWGEHPDYRLSDWKTEVQNDDTRLGYWAWVASCADRAQASPPPLPN